MVESKVEGNKIFIQLQDNMISFIAGQVVSGWVHVDLKQPCFPTENLTIALYGHEKVSF